MFRLQEIEALLRFKFQFIKGRICRAVAETSRIYIIRRQSSWTSLIPFFTAAAVSKSIKRDERTRLKEVKRQWKDDVWSNSLLPIKRRPSKFVLVQQTVRRANRLRSPIYLNYYILNIAVIDCCRKVDRWRWWRMRCRGGMRGVGCQVYIYRSMPRYRSNQNRCADTDWTLYMHLLFRRRVLLFFTGWSGTGSRTHWPNHVAHEARECRGLKSRRSSLLCRGSSNRPVAVCSEKTRISNLFLLFNSRIGWHLYRLVVGRVPRAHRQTSRACAPEKTYYLSAKSLHRFPMF